MKLYYVCSFIFAIVELTIVSGTGSFGMSNLETCLVKKNTNAEYVLGLIFCINIPIMWGSIITVLKNPVSRRNKALRKMVLVLISISLTWGIPSLSPLLRFVFGTYISGFDYLAILLGCCSGLAICFSRLGSKHMLEIAREILSRDKSKDLTRYISRGKRLTTNSLVVNAPHIQEELSIAGFFEGVTKSTTRDMIIGVSLVFITGLKPQNEKSYTYNKNKYIFLPEHLNMIEIIVGRTLFYEERSFEIWEYESDIFENIRGVCGWNNIRISEAFCDENNFKRLENSNNGGRSNAFIFRTHNNELIVKTITKQEKYLLLEILEKYHERVTKHQESRIVRILGLYKIKSSRQTFIIMENLLKNRENALVFDLKGSLNDRYTIPSDDLSQSVLKDQNLIEMNKKVLLEMNEKEKIVKAISDDAMFFKELGIIDYSLIIAFYDENIKYYSRYSLDGDNQSYSFGIIDFLQGYTLSKKIELAYKKMKCKKNLSVCSPDIYAARFQGFISGIFSYE